MKLTMLSFVGSCLGFGASSVSMTMSSGWYPKRSGLFMSSLASWGMTLEENARMMKFWIFLASFIHPLSSALCPT